MAAGKHKGNQWYRAANFRAAISTATTNPTANSGEANTATTNTEGAYSATAISVASLHASSLDNTGYCLERCGGIGATRDRKVDGDFVVTLNHIAKDTRRDPTADGRKRSR